MKIVILGSWSPYVGTEYVEALGIYPDMPDGSIHPEAHRAAEVYAHNIWEPDDEGEDEGPDYSIEIYDPEKHDILKAGGGNFVTDFEWLDRSAKGYWPAWSD